MKVAKAKRLAPDFADQLFSCYGSEEFEKYCGVGVAQKFFEIFFGDVPEEDFETKAAFFDAFEARIKEIRHAVSCGIYAAAHYKETGHLPENPPHLEGFLKNVMEVSYDDRAHRLRQ